MATKDDADFITPEKLIYALNNFSDKALKHWGIERQMIKTCEELSELSVVLLKNVHAIPQGLENEMAIIDEIADVIIMVHQLKSFFGVHAINEHILKKIERAEKRIK